MSTLEATQKAYRHWQRMVAWAISQPPDAEAKQDDMNKAIGEYWSGLYCDLCKEVGHGCDKCILSEIDSPCESDDSIYTEVNSAKTWAEWIKAADRMVRALHHCEMELTPEEDN